jgi:hypothetical protein
MALHLARSFLARPRSHLPLREWWREHET